MCQKSFVDFRIIHGANLRNKIHRFTTDDFVISIQHENGTYVEFEYENGKFVSRGNTKEPLYRDFRLFLNTQKDKSSGKQ